MGCASSFSAYGQAPHSPPRISFLRKELAVYQERHVKPRRVPHTTLMALIWLAGWFDWRKHTDERTRTSCKALSGLAAGQTSGGPGFCRIPGLAPVPPTWTVEQRREVVARTMGCLRETRTSSEAFAQRKQEEKALEERPWKA